MVEAAGRGRWWKALRLAAAVVVIALVPVVAAGPAAADADPPPPLPPGSTQISSSVDGWVWEAPYHTPNSDAPICFGGVYLVYDGESYGEMTSNPRFRSIWMQRNSTPDSPTQGLSPDADEVTSRHELDADQDLTNGSTYFPGMVHTFAGWGVGVLSRIARGTEEHGCEGMRDQVVEWSGYAADFRLWTTRTVVHHAPTVDFDWTITDIAQHEVTFTDHSSDEEDGTNLTYLWTFAPGETSAERDPVHTFVGDGVYPVTLTVSDSQGESSSLTKEVNLDAGLVVNSIGDAPAEDPHGTRCDTGDEVDGDTECTLRAAVQAANARGDGEITFAIDGAGVPEIVLGSALPKLTGSTVLDGTTQLGGLVAVTGGGAAGVELAGGTSTVRGLVLQGSKTSVLVTAGTNHRVERNVLGADPTGATADDTEVGIVSDVPGMEIEANVSGAATAVNLGPHASDAELHDNHFGVRVDGATPLGDPFGGVVTSGGAGQIHNNVIRARTVAVAVAGSSAAGTVVEGNHLGVAASGDAAFAHTGYAVRVDGAPDVTVTGNQVASTEVPGAIVVSGSVNVGAGDDGSLDFTSPTDAPLAGPVTGTHTAVSGNTVGIVGSSTPMEDPSSQGIMIWAHAADVEITGNAVGAAGQAAVDIRDSQGVTVSGNHLGETPGGSPVPVGTGVAVRNSGDITIGTALSPNRVVADTAGITVTPDVTGVRVASNVVRRSDETGSATGILVAANDDGAAVTGNLVEGWPRGIDLQGTTASVSGNTIHGSSEVGIVVRGDQASLLENVVTGGGDGVRVGGDEVTVGRNRIGVEAGADDPVPNTGTGLAVIAGHADVTRNVVVGSGSNGITVADDASAKLRGNRIWDSGGVAIDAPDAPSPPRLAAIRSGSGSSDRITLLLSDLPEGDAGTIEVFANDSCTDPEAKHVLELTRTKSPGEKARIIQLVEPGSKDHFTVTYTSLAGSTSALSACADATSYADTDADGVVDPIDAVLGTDLDPTAAVVATDNEKLLYVRVAPRDVETGVGGGRLEDLGPIDDPTPNSHPPGWSLPYGALHFRISGLDPGASTAVVLADLDPSHPISGDSYWKYGQATPGAADSWYRFDQGDGGTGASILDSAVPPLGLRRTIVLRLTDGGRGDSDGGANTTITDPGGPVVNGLSESSDTTTPSADPLPSITAPVPPAATGGPRPGDGVLARTGTEPGPLVVGGLSLLGLGFVLLVARRRGAAAR